MLNRGVHHSVGVVEAVDHTLHKVKETYPNISIIWRNSPGGHEHCERYYEDKIRTKMRPYESRRVVNGVSHGHLHLWDHVLAQNGDIREMIARKHPAVSFVFGAIDLILFYC